MVGYYNDDDSHWEAVRSLSDWMKEEGVPGISGEPPPGEGEGGDMRRADCPLSDVWGGAGFIR